jgi:SAM-dependent methyltransferase
MPGNHNASSTGDTSTWTVYYDRVGLNPPRPTLLQALASFRSEGQATGTALDLGCGVGRDTLELLRRRWQVTALDGEPEALERLASNAAAAGLPSPRLVLARFEAATVPPVDLVNASFSLFGCPPAAFPGLWRQIRRALRPGGRFAGQLLGPLDSWASRATTTTHTEAELAGLLAGYAVEQLTRETTDSVTPRGEAKRWDIWHVVLRRG